MDTEAGPAAAALRRDARAAGYRRLLGNRALLLLWASQTVSSLGDPFFNLAVMWVVYTQSGSTLQTALVQVVWHLSKPLVSPLAGALADRWDRQRILVWSNLLAAATVGGVALIMAGRGSVSSGVVLVSVFLLNVLTSFGRPAQFSIVPEVVERPQLAAASGLFSMSRQVALLVGNGLAGVVIAVVGAAWALVADAASFVLASLAVAVAPLPARPAEASPSRRLSETPVRRPPHQPAGLPHPAHDPGLGGVGAAPATSNFGLSVLHDIVAGWRAIQSLPSIRALVWLGLLINVSSFVGPLFPALVSERLGGGAAAYGFVQAMGVVGGIAAGAVAGLLERRVGAGRLLGASWALAGLCGLGMAFSTSLPLTGSLEAALAFGLTTGAISSGVLAQALSPAVYRGRVAGISEGLAVIVIPPSALIGGWLADRLGVVPLFAFGGVWTLGVAALAWAKRSVRGASV